MREGNYASTASPNSRHQESDQGLTHSPKISSTNDPLHFPHGPIDLDQELDALLGPDFNVWESLGSQNGHSTEQLPSPKRRKLCEQTKEIEQLSIEELSDIIFYDLGSHLETFQKSIPPSTAVKICKDSDVISNFKYPTNGSDDIIPQIEFTDRPLEVENEKEKPYDTHMHCDSHVVEIEGPLNQSPQIVPISSLESPAVYQTPTDNLHFDLNSLISPIEKISSRPQSIIFADHYNDKEYSNEVLKDAQGLVEDTEISEHESYTREGENKNLYSRSSSSFNSIFSPFENSRKKVAKSSTNEVYSYRLFEKVISSFPMACLLEVSGKGRDNIVALIVELISYGDYRESSSTYQIPSPYRQVFDELMAQWSQGTKKNEFRKALIAYIKEKLEFQMSRGNCSRPNSSSAQLEAQNILIQENEISDTIISQWIDEVKVMGESSKILLRNTFSRGREHITHLRDDNIKLMTENSKLRAEIEKKSAENRNTMNSDSENHILFNTSQAWVFPSVDCSTRYERAKNTDPRQRLKNQLWICCNKLGVDRGQCQQINQDYEYDQINQYWRLCKTCIKCKQINVDKRFYIDQEQDISISIGSRENGPDDKLDEAVNIG